MFDSMKQGFGWGIGTSIARRIFGPSETTTVVQAPAPVPASPIIYSPTRIIGSTSTTAEYEKCLEENNDKEGCKHLLR